MPVTVDSADMPYFGLRKWLMESFLAPDDSSNGYNNCTTGASILDGDTPMVVAVVKFFRGVENRRCASDGEMSGDGKLLVLLVLVGALLVKVLMGCACVGENMADGDAGTPDDDDVVVVRGGVLMYWDISCAMEGNICLEPAAGMRLSLRPDCALGDAVCVAPVEAVLVCACVVPVYFG